MIYNFNMSGNEYKLLSYMQLTHDSIFFVGAWNRYLDRVAKETYMSHRTVQRTIDSLMTKGLIIKDSTGYHIQI